jgi:hypothetical protein
MDVSGYLNAQATLSWGKEPRYRCKYVAEWAAELVWTLLKKENPYVLEGNEPRFLGRSARSIVTGPIMLFRILSTIQFNTVDVY